jgi:hypothetical protein
MNDDIVIRLRNIYTMGQLGVVNEAADEIEKLRRTISVLEHTLEAKEEAENE